MIHSNIWSPLDVSLRLKKNFYDVSEVVNNNTEIADAKAYNLPGVDVDIMASLELIENLKLTLNYYFAGDRWTNYENVNIKMDNINDLNLGGIYDINESFSLNIKANNILSQKYDIWYGYPAQGLNVAGGFTLKF
jgi:outer membrane cobalamin receptor